MKQEGGNINKGYTVPGMHYMGKRCIEHPNVGGVSIRNKNGAPPRKGCAVNGQLSKASNK